MKLTYLLILLVVIALLIDDGDAWRRRRRRRRRRWFRLPRIRLRFRFVRKILGNLCKKHACGYLCDKVLKGDCQYCYSACPKLCAKIGKREFSEQELEDIKNLKAMPSDFNIYDEDNDKKISREEFAKALRSSVRLSREAFDYGDGNSDGFMDLDEFDHAPFYRDENALELLKARFMPDDDIDDDADDNDTDDTAEETLKRLLDDDEFDDMSEDEFARALEDVGDSDEDDIKK